MKIIKKIITKSLLSLGYELRKIDKVLDILELETDEKKIINHIIEKRLSMASASRLMATLIAVKHVCSLKIEGDFVECGVWRGGNSIIALRMINKLKENKDIWLYDTFEGMTKPSEHDYENNTGKKAITEYNQNQRDEHSNWCYASLEDVKENINKFKSSSKINFIKGDITETLKSNHNIPDAISVLRLDTDWYESTKKELEILYPRLSVGGDLIIDDYGHWGGCKKAVDEYFEKKGNKPLLIPSDYTGRISIKV